MATGNVTFRQDWCKGCGLCVAFCPKKIIFLDESITNRKGYHPATVKDLSLIHIYVNFNGVGTCHENDKA